MVSFYETKFILKSLVISSQVEVTIEDLNRDYKRNVGIDIPFRKYGFHSIEQFLSSISDTLIIKYRYGKSPIIYAAASEKTQHIEQYKSIKKNVDNNRNPYIPPHSTNLSEKIVSFQNIPTTIGNEHKNVQNCVHSAEVHSIKCNDTIYEEGKSDDTKENKNTKLQIDEAVPDIDMYDTMFLLNFPKNTVKFGHTINPAEVPENLKVGDQLRLFVTEIHNPYKFWFHIAKQNDELDELMENLENFYLNLEQELVMHISNIVPGQICAAPYTGLWHRAEILEIPKKDKVKVCYIDYGTVSHVQIKSVKYLPLKFSKLNKQALRGSLSHIKLNGLRWSRDATIAFFGLVSNKLLYGKVTEILTNDKVLRLILIDTNEAKDIQINNALILKGHARLSNGESMLHHRSNYPPNLRTLTNLSEKIVSFQNIPTTIDNEPKNVQNCVHSAEVSSIKCNDIIYEEGKSDNTKENKNSKLQIDEAVPDIDMYDTMFLLNFPKNTVKFGHTINPAEIPENLKVGDQLRLFVTEIHNPYKFWFHIAKHNDELDELMENLEIFYLNLEQELVMHISNIVPGQICAAPYTGLWHRAEILEIPKKDKVKVCYIDYGTVSHVQIKSVKYLPLKFSKLNKQALRGSLSHIKSNGLRWSRDATIAFLGLVSNKLLYGKVTEILTNDKVLRLILIDTNEAKDIQINNALILRGHARLSNGESMLHHKSNYPPFKMLESGLYLSFQEIGILLGKGIDYEEKVHNSNIIES